MVEGRSLNQLIERLQQLHLEQERILQALESIAEDQDQIRVTTSSTAIVASQPNKRDTASVPVAVPVPVPVPTTVFHIGQRVYITNRITHVLVCRATEADRTAIVTHFTASRVAIHTINGYHTY
jgi:hypothetical protein